MRKLVVMLFLLASCAVMAQDTIMLPNVEVDAEAIRRNQAEAAMERKMDTAILKRLNTITMAQLLIQHSPVFIKTYGPGGVATASFRGTTASHTLVLWNGFQLNAPSLGQVDFSTIPVYMTEQVALKWGSGTSANSGGLGGVINIDNNQHFGEGLILDLKQTYGSFNTFGSYITAGYSWANHLLRVKAYRTSSDNDFEYYNDAVIPHQVMKQKNADYVDYGVMPEYQWRHRNSLITIVSWNQWGYHDCPQLMRNVWNSDNTKEYTENGYSRNFISYKNYWQTGKIEVKSAYFYEKMHYFLQTYTDATQTQIVSLGTNSYNDANVFHQIADLNQDLYKSWKLNAKVQYDYEKVNSNNYDSTQRADRNVLSFYAALTGKLLKPLDIRLTLRNDWVDWESEGFFPTATLSYSALFVKGLSINVGYSHNYRNPTLNDLYWCPGGKPDLKPEKGKTVDGNIMYSRQFGKLSVDGTVGTYYSLVKDWIQWVPTSWRYWEPENVNTVTAYGVEAHLKMSYFIDYWNFSLSGNYVYSHTTDESGNQLIYIPLHHANAYFETRWKTWYFTYTMEYTGRRKTQMDDDEVLAGQLPPYTLHHVSFGKQIWHFDVEFKINNLTDVSYQAVLYRAMPGRSYEISVNYKL